MEQELSHGQLPPVLSTNPDDPVEGRCFVRGAFRWYERLQGEMDNVAFSPVANSEEELRRWLSEQGVQDLGEPPTAAARVVQREFLEQLFPEVIGLSEEDFWQLLTDQEWEKEEERRW